MQASNGPNQLGIGGLVDHDPHGSSFSNSFNRIMSDSSPAFPVEGKKAFNFNQIGGGLLGSANMSGKGEALFECLTPMTP